MKSSTPKKSQKNPRAPYTNSVTQTIGNSARKDMRIALGRFIAEKRQIAGLSQAELAERCGKGYNVVVAWENADKPHVSVEDSQKLIEILQLEEVDFKRFMPVIEKRAYKQTQVCTALGANIARRLEEIPMTRKDLSRILELYPQHITLICDGKNEPRGEQIKVIVKKLFEEYADGRDVQAEALSYLYYGTPFQKVSYRDQLTIAKARIKFLENEVASLKRR